MNARKRQIAISLNQSGVIGVEEKLLFSSAADLQRFAIFTDGTAMIVGRLTAQQMISAGVRISERRPMIIISGTGSVEGTTDHDAKNFYYVSDLAEALVQAEVLVLDTGINGYTIVGGKRVYDEYLDLVDTGKVRPNAAYLFSHEMDVAVPAIALKRDCSQIKKLLEVRMAEPREVWHEANVMGKDYAGNVLRTINGRFSYMYDKREIDPFEVKQVGSQVRVDTDGGEMCIDLFRTTGWQRKREINAVEIHVLGGQTITVRPRTVAGLNSLLFALNMTAFA